MNLSSKIKGLLQMNNKTLVELSEYLGVSRQAVYNKVNRGTFSAEDLIRIADFIGCELLYRVNGKQEVKLDIDDIPPKGRRKDEDEPPETDEKT